MNRTKRILSKLFALAVVFSIWITAACGNTKQTIGEVSTESISSETETSQISATIDVSTTETLEDNLEETVEEEPDPALEILEGMTLDEKIWQMIIVTPDQLTNGVCTTEVTEAFLESLQEKPVGGIVYYGINLVDREQTISMTQKTLDYGYEVEGLPLFLCIDEEGGRVARIGCREQYGVEWVGPMSRIADENSAFNAGYTIGAYLSELGFNFDMAPDADVLTDPNNEAIGDRSFGTDPQLVSDLAAAFSDGLHESGVMSCYKHFPGHGGVTGDTHYGFIQTQKTLDELMGAELIPFAQAQENNIDCVMIAHISCPNVTQDDTPASLSKELITGILRENLNYDGLVMTDALNMTAIDSFSQENAATLAVVAGADLILVPSDIDAAFYGIKHAVEIRRISEERIDESVLRIIRAKLNLE